MTRCFQGASHEAGLQATPTGVYGSLRSKQSPHRNTETLEQRVRKNLENSSPRTVNTFATMSNTQYPTDSLWKANKADCCTVRNHSAKNRRVKKIITNYETHIWQTKCGNNNIILGSLEITPKVEKLLENQANMTRL